MSATRPQIFRPGITLNGDWTVNGQKGYVPECRTEEKLVYETDFYYDEPEPRVILHFGAADQIADVYLNGEFLGRHIGGYLPFSFEVTGVIKEENQLRVEVTDTLDHTYPYGKQRKDRGGMWYTPVSGLWRSVWLEGVPETYMKDIRITPDLKGVTLDITVDDKGKIYRTKERIDVEDPILWTPDNPMLYHTKLRFRDDAVDIYYALRTVEIKKINGVNRLLLNGKPIFLHGVLDQGYFEGGGFRSRHHLIDDYENDVKRMKELGFNFIRKHIKIEDEAFYHACDKYGILVLQDMVNSGDYHYFKDTVLGSLGVPFSDKKKPDERTEFFVKHSEETINHLYNHPCVIGYTIFNEGWGQFNSDELYERFKTLDSTRVYDSTSGWFKQKKSDFDSLHIYFRLKKLKPKKRPLLLSECGGYTLALQQKENTYGYGRCENTEELTSKIEELYDKMVIPAIKSGLCGCVYTQLSDIEDEINGLYSFDRTVCKVDKERMKKIAERIYAEIEKV